ncbi:M48 family metalloprotease [Paraburkholderia sp.]|uniref:M48 family metalloprotease n=1 Tax=Paraburkholderia sp. TaxID=1926495 RepID=UPI0039E69F67
MKRFVARCTPWGTIQTGAFFARLTDAEKSAVLAHEQGHLHYRHQWYRLWWVFSLQILIRPQWVCEQCVRQEFAADAYAVARGHGAGLRMFLRRFPQTSSLIYPDARQRLEALDG